MKVVVVGGGFAGVKTALELDRRDGMEVVLISPYEEFRYHGGVYRARQHKRLPLESNVLLSDVFGDSKRVTLVQDSLVAIDPKRKVIKGFSGQLYAYDQLVLAMGLDMERSDVPGVRHFTYSPYTTAGAEELRAELMRLCRMPHRSYVRMILVGAGSVGVEFAAEARHFAEDVARKYGLNPKLVEVELIERQGRVLPRYTPEVSERAHKRLEKLGIKIVLNHAVERCSQNSVRLDDRERAADVIVWATGGKPQQFFVDHPKLFSVEQDRIVVDEYLRAKGTGNIFVIGDSAYTLHSGTIEAALNDAVFVANNLVRTHKGKTADEYTPRMPVQSICLGDRWAIRVDGEKVKSGLMAWRGIRKIEHELEREFPPLKRAAKKWRKTQ